MSTRNEPAKGTSPNERDREVYDRELRGFDILVLTVAPMLLWHGGSGVEISVGLSVLTIAVLIGRD